MSMRLHCYQSGPGDRGYQQRSRLAWRCQCSKRNLVAIMLLPANFKSTEMRETGGGEGGGRNEETDRGRGGRDILWGTQQGHLPGAIWWLRRFYTVVFVCLLRLGFLPGSAAGQVSVIIYLPPSLPFCFTTLNHLSLCFSVLCCCYPRNLLGVVIVTDAWCWLEVVV